MSPIFTSLLKKIRLFISDKALLFLFCIPLFLINHGVFAQGRSLSGEDVVFKSGEIVLNGRLVLPDSAQNVPVLVFMGGRYEWGDPHPQRTAFIKENLEAVFPATGVGIFYYDARGTGRSGGRWGRATMSDFANDAEAAIHYLSQRREIDPNRIGLVGLSEGGWISQIVAARSPETVKFVVSLGSAPFNANRQLVNEYYSEYVCNGQDEAKALEKAEQKALSHQNWVSWLPITKSWRHMNNTRNFDPAAYIRKINIPALFIYGENNRNVSSTWAIEEFQELYPDALPNNFTVETIPGANQFFHVVDPCYQYPGESEDPRLNFSFRFKEVFQNWIFQEL